MLRACKTLLRDDGRMAFFTIFVPSGLTPEEYRTAVRSGPSAVSSRGRDHRELLAAAGFSRTEEIDLTPEFREAASTWYFGRERHAAELIAAEGEDSFNERQQDSRSQLEAIEAGRPYSYVPRSPA